MAKIASLINTLNQWAPFDTQMDYDNAGLLIGDENAAISGILSCLDITDEVIDEAIEIGANVIVAHHPLIFRKLRSIRYENEEGRLIRKLIKHDLHHIAVHTNLDAAQDGVSFLLAEQLGLRELTILEQHEKATQKYQRPIGFGMVGELAEALDQSAFLDHIARKLGTNAVRFSGNHKGTVKRVAVCGGTAVSLLPQAIANQVDAFVTADIKYHEYFHHQANFLLVDAGHYETEQAIIRGIQQYLTAHFPEIAVHATRVITNPMATHYYSVEANSQEFQP
jgi:dinuclear metal center YbgI/SA1388 family protein